jgi:hypothetical protein
MIALEPGAERHVRRATVQPETRMNRTEASSNANAEVRRECITECVSPVLTGGDVTRRKNPKKGALAPAAGARRQLTDTAKCGSMVP